MRMAIPPLFPFARRSSWTWYPGISSFTLECCSHVSYTHRTSIFFVSSIIWSLNKLTPAIFMLPIVIPAFYQRVFLATFLFFTRTDPFVRFFLLPLYLFWSSVCVSPLPNFPFSLLLLQIGLCWALPRFCTIPLRDYLPYIFASFISGIVVAHAQRGAFPLSTPAGL